MKQSGPSTPSEETGTGCSVTSKYGRTPSNKHGCVGRQQQQRIIVLNLKEKKEKNDRDRVIEMIGHMGVRVREEEIVDVVQMKKKDEGGLM